MCFYSKYKTLPAILLLVVFPAILYAQQLPEPLTDAEKNQVMISLSKQLNDSYIDPDIAKQMISLVSTNEKNGNYKSINDPIAFSDQLTRDLVSVSHDGHLNISFDPAWVQESKKVLTAKDSLDLENKDFPNARQENFGFKDVRILDGNIGYLNLTKFYNPVLGATTAIAAMNLLSNTDALIIDLRQNGGGYGSMVQLLASYLFTAEPVLLVEFYSRENPKPKQDWTLPYVTGNRMPDIDVYILTSQGTFSAAESFTYFLKNRKRATIVGATTGGGAHPVQHKALSDRFSIFLPYGKPVDPITQTNWEGVGVTPDIAVAPKDALFTAQMAALEKLVAAHPENKNTEWALADLKATQHPVTVSLTTLQNYTGTYGSRKLTFEAGKLFYQKTGMSKYQLTPLAPDLFKIEELSYLRIKMNTKNGAITGFTRMYNDGTSFTDLKSK